MDGTLEADLRDRPSTVRPAAALTLVAAWALLVGMSLVLRPILPIDETRYVSVAWEMWLRGDFLVPHLNGLPYSEKPPLLFWLMQLGWRVFGVNEWWPRLVPGLFSLANLFLTGALARRLWPDRPETARQVPAILLGFLVWSVFTTLIMFDMLVAFCVLVALLAIHQARRGGGTVPWLAAGAALGLGILAKGPVALLVPLLVALLEPWWGKDLPQMSRLRWWLGTTGAVTLAAAIALAWALPAAAAGGEAYGQSILLTQTGKRIVSALAHRHPWWWYLPLLPVLTFPYSLWPPLWKAIRRMQPGRLDTGQRFCLAWLVPGLVAFSAISSKQPHYLLPLCPAFALLAAHLPEEAPGVGFARIFPGRRVAPTLITLTLLLALQAGFAQVAREAYDLGPISHYLAAIERQGRPIAIVGAYHGQFHFLGRLERPFEVIDGGAEHAWLLAHPRGRVIQELDDVSPGIDRAEFTQRYRSHILAVWKNSGGL